MVPIQGCGESLSAIRSAAFRTQFEQWLSTCNGELPATIPRSSTSQRGGPEPTVSSENPSDPPPPTSFPPSPQPSPASKAKGRDPASVATAGSSNDTPSPPPPSPQSSAESHEGDLAPAEVGGSSNDTHSIPLPPPQSPPGTDQTGRGRSSNEQVPIRNLLWCVNLERAHTVVETIPVDMNDKDKEIFIKLRHVYNATRSWRRASFHILNEIRYVRV